MSVKWTGSQSESGILRKSEFKEKKEELFVFGYSCKLFRDDDKALLIDQGKHLIPWMGDETLKVDRYDARGALHDLSSLEAPPGGFDWRVELTRTELDVEQRCDEERYRALHTDEDEEEMYKEEELKRLHAAGYGQVGFNYDIPAEPEPATQSPAEVDEPFVPAPSYKALFNGDIVFPDTDKQNVIIEKTAKFIAFQGAQMEILIKAKQGDNPQFKFLNRDAELHPYYMTLIGLIKAGKWPEKKVEVVEEKTHENDDYLHPSLASTIIESAPSIPSIHYKPSSDCDYTMLICKMRGEATLDEAYEPPLAPGELPPPGTEPPPLPPPAQHLLQHLPPPSAHAQISRPPMMYNQTPDPIQQTVQYQQQYAVYYQQYMAQNALSQAAALQTQAQVQVPPPLHKPPPQKHEQPSKPAPLKSTGLSLMKNYNTDSDSDDSDSDDSSSIDSKDRPAIITPPEDVCIVIDKMAAYVARNGDEFAEIVRAKNDPRFTFLDPSDVHHAYYLKLMRAKRGEGEGVKKNAGNPTVSFSIKKLKEPDPILPKPALPYESSSDEEDSKTEKPTEKQDKESPKINIPQTFTVANMPPVVVYKMEGTTNNLPVVKAIETTQVIPKPAPITPTVLPDVKQMIEEKIPDKVVQKDEIQEKVVTKSEEVKRLSPEKKDIEKESERVRERERSRDIDNNVEKSRGKDSRREKSKESERNRDAEKRKLKDKKKDYSSKSDRDYKRTSERGKKKERASEKVKKRKKYSKDDLDNEIISLEDNSDEMIDLTGDHSDSKGDGDPESDKAKQLERRRRAAEFLRKVGVDPAAPLPASSLASAMVDTLESIRKKKAEEEEKRLKREKRRHRDKHGHGENGDKTHRKSKRRKYKSSEDEESDYDSSKKKRKKKDKKHSSKPKKKRRKEITQEEIEEEEEEEDHPLPPNMDLTTTLKELRTSSPTKDLIQDVVEESQQAFTQESSSEEEAVRRRKKKKEDREYSEGEWSSDSEADSEVSSTNED